MYTFSKEAETVEELIAILEEFPPETEVSGVGGGAISLCVQENEPDRIWFE